MSLNDFCSCMTECALCGTLSMTNEGLKVQKPKMNSKPLFPHPLVNKGSSVQSDKLPHFIIMTPNLFSITGLFLLLV